MKSRIRRDIRTTAAPLTDAVRKAAEAQLPKAGGLNKVVAGQRVTVSVLMGASATGIRLVTRDTGGSKRDNKGTDEGVVRHPTFGMYGYDRSYWHWVSQEIPAAAGWWSKTLAAKQPVVGAALERTIESLSAEIVGR